MSIFDRLDWITSRVVDRQFANAFACTPMLSTPNGRSAPDPERGPWEGVGILEEVPANVPVDIGARNRSNDMRSLVIGALYELSVDRTRYPAADAVKQRDRFAIGTQEFEVLAVQPDGLSRTIFALQKLASVILDE